MVSDSHSWGDLSETRHLLWAGRQDRRNAWPHSLLRAHLPSSSCSTVSWVIAGGKVCPSYSSSGSPTSSLEHQLLFLSPSSHVGRKAGAPSHWAKGCRLAMHLSGRGTNSDKAAANHRTIYGAWKRLLSFPLALKPHSEAQRTITVRHIIFEYKGQQSVRQSAVQSDFLGNISTLLFFSLCDNFVISSSRG